MNSIYFTEWPTCSRENESSLSVRYAQVRCIFSSLFVSRNALKSRFYLRKKGEKEDKNKVTTVLITLCYVLLQYIAK